MNENAIVKPGQGGSVIGRVVMIISRFGVRWCDVGRGLGECRR